MSIPTLDTRTVRRWKRYPEYRPSGANWHTEVPAHWQVLRMKYVAALNPSKSDVARLPDATEVSFLPMERIGEDGSLSLELTRPLGEVRQGFTYFRTGDVLVAKITPCFENGKGARADGLANGIGFGTTELHVLRAGSAIDGRYLELVTRLHAFREQGASEMYGAAGQQRVPEWFLRDYLAPLPPVAEQRAIAAFLDRETARTDALIGHKERLIALLEEKRQALISHAVTRGLDDNAPINDSGLPFVGPIPAHWSVKALGHTLHFISYGFTNPMPNADEGPYLLTANDIGEGRILFETARRTTWEAFRSLLTNKSRPQRGDLLITKDGTLGRTAICDGTVCCINQSVAVLRTDAAQTSVDYLHEALQSSPYQQRLVLDAGGTTIKHIYISRLSKMALALPPLSEQLAIAQYCDNSRKELYRLIGRIRDGIARLQEYRTALISAAVTGQIDVRGEVTQ